MEKIVKPKKENWILKHPTGIFVQNAIAGYRCSIHILLTRHLRAGYWRGLPQWADEILILWNVIWDLFILLGGTSLMLFRAKGKQGILLGGILLYHVAAISALAGLTRYRVPLEPIFDDLCWRMVWVLCNVKSQTCTSTPNDSYGKIPNDHPIVFSFQLEKLSQLFYIAGSSF